MLRIPAISLGFIYRGEWDAFIEEHEDDFDWKPGFFAEAICSSYDPDDYLKWHIGEKDNGPWELLDWYLYLGIVKYAPGPFLDYYLEEIAPLPSEENTYHENDCARPLTLEEKEKFLPLYQELFPDFTIEKMDDVHYCQYEWYDGADASYLY